MPLAMVFNFLNGPIINLITLLNYFNSNDYQSLHYESDTKIINFESNYYPNYQNFNHVLEEVRRQVDSEDDSRSTFRC